MIKDIDNYLVTSAFIGASFDSKLFFNLYVKLNEYVKMNSLKDTIILQDILSIHVTLHYLDKNITQGKLRYIRLGLMTLRESLGPIKITGFNYLYDDKKEKVCYFELFDPERLADINQKLKADYPLDVQGNTYKYIPHVTLFKIKRHLEFKKHQKNLEKIISNFVEQIADKNFRTKISIFLVNSDFEPELQIPC